MDMSPNSIVHTVYCPYCKRYWTGEFTSPLPDKAVCKDCVRKDYKLGKNHPHVKRQDLPEFRGPGEPDLDLHDEN